MSGWIDQLVEFVYSTCIGYMREHLYRKTINIEFGMGNEAMQDLVAGVMRKGAIATLHPLDPSML